MTATPTPATPVSFISRPVVKVLAYLLSWFVFSLSIVLLVYAVQAVGAVGGTCASGNTAYVIQTPCPEATNFLPWVIFTGLIAVGVGATLANGIGIQARVWAWPFLFDGLGLFFLAAGVFAGQVVGWILGVVFILMGLVPLIIELRASAQRVFLGSFNVFGQQFYEGPKAQPSFSSRKMPNPPDAIKPTAGAWLFALLGFAIPAVAGYEVATLWVSAIGASQG